MKVLRSTFVAAVAIFAAACGDKVNVVGPSTTTATPDVTAISVSPNTATLSIGQTINLTAAVTAVNGAAATVTWSSSDASKVSVSATGVASAVAASPGVAVCATSTVNLNTKGCASIVVSAAPTTIPATVSIQTITINGNLNAPINPGGVAGVIDVRANVSPGTESVNKVVVMVGTVRADSQTFTAAQAASLRYAADQAIAEQSAFPPILFSINTAKFNGTTGIAAYPNGAYPISVLLYVNGNTNARSTATYQTPLTFANADGYLATLVTSGTVANINNAAGFRYDRGAITATALPIIFSGRTIASMTLLFGSAACDANATGQRNIAMAITTGTTWGATLPSATPSGGSITNTVTNYEFTNNGICTLNNVGESIAVTAVDANGDAVFAAATPVNVAALTSLRLDNKAPIAGSPTLIQNPNTRGNGWINASVNMVGTNASSPSAASTTSNSMNYRPAAVACAGGTAARDCGEGSYIYFVRIAASATGLVDEARAATASGAPTLPAPSLTATTYCMITTAQDALGNESARPGTGTACAIPTAGAVQFTTASNHTLFGVDIAAPTIAFLDSTATTATQGLNSDMRRNTAAAIGNGTGQNFIVTVLDTGAIGNSGMLAAAPVFGTVKLRNDAAATPLTAAKKCIVGRISASDGVTCNTVAVTGGVGGGAPAFPLVAVLPATNNSDGTLLSDASASGTTSATTVPGATAITSQNVPGYYTYTATGRDAAGNTTAAITRVIGYNLTANVPSLTTALFNVPLSGSTAVFNANSSTNFDIWKSTYNLAYAGANLAGVAAPVLFPSAVLNTFNGTQLFSNVAAGITLNNFMRQVETVTSACNAAAVAAAGGAFKPSGLNGTVTDQANVSSAVAATPIAGASVTTGVSYTAAAAPLKVASFYVNNGVTGCPTAAEVDAAVNISTGAGPAAAVNPLFVALTADVYGPTATFNSPFTRVDFYALVAGNLELIGSSTSFTTTDDGSTTGRRHRFTFSWTPGTTSPISSTAWVLGAQTIVAIGVNSLGDALVSANNVNVTLTNP